MDIIKTEVWGFEHAIRGARKPIKSRDKYNSVFNLQKCHASNLEFCDRKCIDYK